MWTELEISIGWPLWEEISQHRMHIGAARCARIATTDEENAQRDSRPARSPSDDIINCNVMVTNGLARRHTTCACRSYRANETKNNSNNKNKSDGLSLIHI